MLGLEQHEHHDTVHSLRGELNTVMGELDYYKEKQREALDLTEKVIMLENKNKELFIEYEILQNQLDFYQKECQTL